MARNTERKDFRIEDMLYTGIFRQKAKIHDINPSKMPGETIDHLVTNCYSPFLSSIDRYGTSLGLIDVPGQVILSDSLTYIQCALIIKP